MNQSIYSSQRYKEKCHYILQNKIQSVLNNIHNISYFISILIEEYVSMRLHRTLFKQEIFIVVSENNDFFIKSSENTLVVFLQKNNDIPDKIPLEKKRKIVIGTTAKIIYFLIKLRLDYRLIKFIVVDSQELFIEKKCYKHQMRYLLEKTSEADHIIIIHKKQKPNTKYVSIR